MKNGTPSSALRFSDGPDEGERIEQEPPSLIDGALHNKWVFVAVCVACATGAIAAGSYAAWLHKKRDTQTAILDVHDLLQSCEERVAQIEAEIKRMNPGS